MSIQICKAMGKQEQTYRNSLFLVISIMTRNSLHLVVWNAGLLLLRLSIKCCYLIRNMNKTIKTNQFTFQIRSPIITIRNKEINYGL